MALVRVTWPHDHRAAFSQNLIKQALAACEEIGDDALEKSNRVIPIEEGILQDSGFVEVERVGVSEMRGQVAYNTPYAVVQHEDPTLQHDDGRKDHYLEDTVNENREAWERHMATRMRKATSSRTTW